MSSPQNIKVTQIATQAKRPEIGGDTMMHVRLYRVVWQRSLSNSAILRAGFSFP